MQVKFLNLKHCHNEIESEVNAAWVRVSQSGHYILGQELISFEKKFANFNKLSFAVGVANGLDALIILLKALGVKSGDEVIVPAHTFIATWLAVSHVGAIPIPVDIDETTFNIDVGKVIQKLSSRTRAIIAVNLYGRRANLEQLAELCADRGMNLIVDAAQSHGVPALRAPHVHFAYSFYPGKNLGCLGDGGAIVSDNEELVDTIKMIRNYGSSVKYVHEIEGINSRLDELQAAILNVKLDRIEQWNQRRRDIANIYISGLHDVAGIVLPAAPVNNLDHVWHLFVIRTANREKFQNYLKSNGIETVIHYPTPPYKQGAYKHLGYSSEDFLVSSKVSDEVLSLPIGPHISDDEIYFVIDNIKSYFKG